MAGRRRREVIGDDDELGRCRREDDAAPGGCTGRACELDPANVGLGVDAEGPAGDVAEGVDLLGLGL